MVEHRTESLSSQETDSQATHVWLMRHGPTEWNMDRRIQGNVDTPLIPEALQAYLEKQHIERLPKIDRVIVSEFQRTHKTADAIAKQLGWSDIPRVVIPELNERKWGIFEGKTHSEVREFLSKDPKITEQYPELQAMTDLSPILDEPDFAVEGAESMRQVAARVEPVVKQLREKYPGESILVVGHAGVMLSLGLDHRVINQLALEKTGDTITMHRLSE